MANFIIASENIFNEKAIIHENWVKGKQHIIKDYNNFDVRGRYDVNGSEDKPQGTIYIVNGKDTIKEKATITVKGSLINLSFNVADSVAEPAYLRLSGAINYNNVIWDGNAQLPNGDWVKWSAIRKKDDKKDDKKKVDNNDSLAVPNIKYPLMAY